MALESLSLRSQRTTWYKRSSCSHYFWGGSRHSRMNIYDRIGPTIQPLLSKVMWNPVWYEWRGIGSKKFIAGICQKSMDVSRKKNLEKKRRAVGIEPRPNFFAKNFPFWIIGIAKVKISRLYTRWDSCALHLSLCDHLKYDPIILRIWPWQNWDCKGCICGPRLRETLAKWRWKKEEELKICIWWPMLPNATDFNAL